jgi:ATP-dependent helicase HrpB
MAAVPAHPRCAHMVLRAQQLGAAELGCVLATLLDERDLFRGAAGGGGAADSSDVAARVRAVLGQGAGGCTACPAGIRQTGR